MVNVSMFDFAMLMADRLNSVPVFSVAVPFMKSPTSLKVPLPSVVPKYPVRYATFPELVFEDIVVLFVSVWSVVFPAAGAFVPVPIAQKFGDKVFMEGVEVPINSAIKFNPVFTIKLWYR